MNSTPSQTNLFALALGDIFSPRVLLVSLISFLLTLVVFALAIWAFFGGIGALVDVLSQQMQGIEGSFENNWLLRMISVIFITKTIAMVLFFLMSAMVIYYLFLVVYSLIVGLFSGYFIKEIGTLYYPEVNFLGMGFFAYIGSCIKTVLLASALFIVLFPLAFIPMLNFILLVPVFYLFHKLLVLEVSSMVHTNEEYKIIKARYAGQLRGISLLCFALTLIPVLGVIIYPYYVIVMSHFVMRKTKELRAL